MLIEFHPWALPLDSYPNQFCRVRHWSDKHELRHRCRHLPTWYWIRSKATIIHKYRVTARARHPQTERGWRASVHVSPRSSTLWIFPTACWDMHKLTILNTAKHSGLLRRRREDSESCECCTSRAQLARLMLSADPHSFWSLLTVSPLVPCPPSPRAQQAFWGSISY